MISCAYLVEDEVRLAATLQDLLELNGYTVDVCHDGEAGLDNALTSIYDVIPPDDVPSRDGFTAAAPPVGGVAPRRCWDKATARSELTDRVNGLTLVRTTISPSPLSQGAAGAFTRPDSPPAGVAAD